VVRNVGRPGFTVETSEGVIEASRVVAATGPFQKPVIPAIAPQDERLLQIHSADYRNPQQLPAGAVLVVGAGSSGVQIADELQRSGKQVYLSVGAHDRPPRAYRNRDFCWWLGVLGEWDQAAMKPGREHVTIAVSGAHGGRTIDFRGLAHRGMTLVGVTESFNNGVVTFKQDLLGNLNRGDENYLALLDAADARDVVGHNEDYPELIARWYQYGTFLPTMRAHGMRKHTEAWSYGKQAEAVIAKYLKLRYTLMPYIYSLGKHTYDTGAPFMRPLFMDFPNDAKVSNLGDQYMFGPAFLVAPMTEQGMTSREVYLPAGSDCYDFWTNKKYAGGQTITAAAPIDIIPLFVRAGSIIPMGEDIQSTATAQSLKEVRVYPGRDAEFVLYDDDGVSNEYEKGIGSITRLAWDNKSQQLSASGDKTISRLIKQRIKVIQP
jgi:hypothetical protein